MNYEQTKKLLDRMDRIETCGRLMGHELAKEDTNWDTVSRHQNSIEASRKDIFDLVQGL